MIRCFSPNTKSEQISTSTSCNERDDMQFLPNLSVSQNLHVQILKMFKNILSSSAEPPKQIPAHKELSESLSSSLICLPASKRTTVQITSPLITTSSMSLSPASYCAICHSTPNQSHQWTVKPAHTWQSHSGAHLSLSFSSFKPLFNTELLLRLSSNNCARHWW